MNICQSSSAINLSQQSIVNKQIKLKESIELKQRKSKAQNLLLIQQLQQDQQSKQITQYFTKAQYHFDTLQTVQNYSKQVLSNIIQAISYGTLQIKQYSKPQIKDRLFLQGLSKNKKTNVNYQSQYKQHMKSLQKQKNQTIDKLHKIYQDQKKLLNLKNYNNNNNIQYSNSNSCKQSQNSHYPNNSQRKLIKIQRSFITAEQKIKIRSLVKAKNQFQQQLQNRVNKILQKVKQKQILSQKQKQQQKQSKIKKRRYQIIQHHKQYQTQLKKIQNKNQHINSQRKVTYFYIEKQKEDQQKSAEKQKYNRMVAHQKKQKMKTDYQLIRSQAIQHDQYIEKKRIQSENAFLQKSKVISKKYEQNQFSKILKIQQDQKKLQHQNKIRIKKQYNHKIKQFRDYVRSNFSPSINDKSKFVSKNISIPSKNLTAVQRSQVGNKYLQVAKKLKRISPRTTNHLSTQHDFLNPQSKSFKYPNYLTNLHEQRYKIQKNKIRTQYSQSQDQLKKLLSIQQRDLTDFQVKKAYKLTKQIENSSYIFHKNKNKQYDLMKDKLKLLQAIVKK